MFISFAFLCGWYFRVHEKPVVFSGRLWLNCFAIVLIISFAASFFRYCPPWQWGSADFISQPINSLGMERQDAVRYVVFAFCNMITAILLIFSTCSIIKTNSNPKRTQNHILAALLIGTALAILVAFYQYFGNINWCANAAKEWIDTYRANGTCSDPNALAGLLILIFPLAVCIAGYLLQSNCISGKIFGIISAVIALISAIALRMTGSSTGLFVCCLVIGLFLFLLVHRKTYKYLEANFEKNRWHKSYIIVSILLYIIIFLSPAIYIYKTSLQETQKHDQLISWKLNPVLFIHKLWWGNRKFDIPAQDGIIFKNYARKIAGKFPVTGIGIGAFVIEIPNFVAADGNRLTRSDNANSYYWNLFVETGFPGLLCFGIFFLIIIFRLFREIIKNKFDIRQRTFIFLVPLVIYLLALITGAHIMANEVGVVFAVYVGLCVSECHIKKQSGKFKSGIFIFLSIVFLTIYAWRTYSRNHVELNGERLLAVAGVENEAGWYEWENWENIPYKVRWTKKNASLTTKRKNIELVIPISCSENFITRHREKVVFYINGVKVKEHIFITPGTWSMIRLYASPANPFADNLEQYVTLRIAVDKTWQPDILNESKDMRELGIAVGEIEWQSPKQFMGGWFDRELWQGSPFRWFGRYAWRKIIVSSNRWINIPVYSANPLQKFFPVKLAVCYNNTLLDVININNNHWEIHRAALPNTIDIGETGVVEFAVSRVWKPANFGYDDKRELGVAIGEIASE